MKFWLLTPTLNQGLRQAILKTILTRKRIIIIINKNNKPQQKWKHRLQQVAITKLGTASRKEHKYSSVCQSSKRCEKKWGATHQQRQLATVYVDIVFHRNFSSADWTDQHVLPATLRQAGPSRWLPDITLLDMMTFVALALQMGHELKNTLRDYWSRLRQLHNPF